MSDGWGRGTYFEQKSSAHQDMDRVMRIVMSLGDFTGNYVRDIRGSRSYKGGDRLANYGANPDAGVRHG